MKYFLLPLLLSATVFVSCKKENIPAINADTNKLSVENAIITSTGNIVFYDEGNAGGVVKIYLRKDGVYVLGLEQMNYKTISDMNVYFSPTPGLTIASIKLFSSKNFCGNTYYTLPSAINAAAFTYLIIQNDTDAGPAASAKLN